ncbi:MAG: type II secretion system F family protein [Victivallales bacterium]|nr:type II secretion system F family protein [Victivallales bacterium]
MQPEFREMAAAGAAGVSVLLITLVIAEFFAYTSKTYKEKFIQEASTELDDVLLQMPPGRILDFSLALSALAAFLGIAVFAFWANSWSWPKAVFIGASLAIASFPLPRIYLRYKKKQRLTMFNEQLEDALTSMSSALKAGFSINQALETIAQDNRRPISVEFRLLVQEVRLGVHLETALHNMEERMQSDDLELVSTAIITARQTGGELTVIFERLAGVIRERSRIQGRIRSLTAQGRLQAIIVAAMPYMLMLAMSYIAPQMMSMFFDSMIGILMIVGVTILVIKGFLVIKKITTIDI